MKERPILFSAPMVRAILDGRKTQTRRKVKPKWSIYPASDPRMNKWSPACPYGRPGDLLWVRETAIVSPPNWCDLHDSSHPNAPGGPRVVQYLASEPCREAANTYKLKATPSIFMPRWASRITLEITGVRAERLKDISEADAIAEGAEWAACGSPQEGSHKAGYAELWEEINGPGSWDVNPWVWVIEFNREAA